jgi:hypothetical protein
MSKISLQKKKLQIKNILVAAYNARASYNLHQLGLISYDRFCVNYITEFQSVPKFDLTNTINWLRDPTTRNNKDLILPGIIDKDNLFQEDFYNDGIDYSGDEILELEEYLDDTYELLFKI